MGVCRLTMGMRCLGNKGLEKSSRTIKQQIEMFNPQAGSLADEFYDTVAVDPEDDPSLLSRSRQFLLS